MNNWPTKKLGEVLEYEQPTKYLVSSTDYGDEYAIPVLTAGKSFVLGNTNEKNGIFPKEKLPVIIFDDFTTAIKFVDFPFKVKSSAMKILHAKKNEADIRFLFYKMLTIKFVHDQHKRYWISECSNIKIPLPPLDIQKQIVERLDKIVEAQKLNDGLIQKTDELFQSLLHKELNPAGKDWEVKKLSETGDIITGTTPSTQNADYWNGEFLWATPTDIKKDTFVLTDTPKKLSHEGYEKTRPVPKNSILVTCIASIGKMAIAGKEMATNQQINSIVCNKNSDPLFIFFSLQKDKKKLISLGKTTAVPIMNKSEFGRIKIFLPPLKIQKQIVAKLSAVQDYKKQLLEQKEKLKELFDSALAKSMSNK